MPKRNVIDKRKIRLKEVMDENYIPFLGGRPKRNTIISDDEVLNLSIALNTSKNLDEFLTGL
ncbi:MAG: hypothetical protein GF344_01370 [Chitinivibrionales bacterium]|nr:hypothetical protein [Chitinivibrionales bacterium]